MTMCISKEELLEALEVKLDAKFNLFVESIKEIRESVSKIHEENTARRFQDIRSGENCLLT